MKFKAIKPGMVIHCQTKEDAKALLEHLDRLGYVWDNFRRDKISNDTHYEVYKENTCYKISPSNKAITYGESDCESEAGYEITEFSDLIEPDDSPMMAEELLKWIREGFINGCAGLDNRLREVFNTISVEDILTKFTAEEIIEKIERYEVAKKEKTVEVEEGYYCCVYKASVGRPVDDYVLWGVDKQTAEDDARCKALKHTKETGEQMRVCVEFTCRAKEDEL